MPSISASLYSLLAIHNGIRCNKYSDWQTLRIHGQGYLSSILLRPDSLLPFPRRADGFDMTGVDQEPLSGATQSQVRLSTVQADIPIPLGLANDRNGGACSSSRHNSAAGLAKARLCVKYRIPR